ncbi:hypothetical protein QGP82_21435 [Leptothoe sp. LEGE 181152]|nr:hypothetical protein [Leptothoe sp. LEGE 181152]
MDSEQIKPLAEAINNLWLIVSFVLVVMMQPGFAYLEAGLIRSTNVINVLFKNAVDFCLGGICFFLIGYSLMWNIHPDWVLNVYSYDLSFIGKPAIGWLNFSSEFPGGILPRVHFLFNLAFVGTTITICSGIVAGRIKLQAYFWLVGAITTVIYPIVGHWVWTKYGWLNQLGYYDFAGSSAVHCVGGFAGLAGAWILGPRIAKADKNELAQYRAAEVANYRQTENRPHNLSLSTLGTFLLLIGWLGFNGGSVGALITLSDNGMFEFNETVGTVLLNTILSCFGGGLFATITSAVINGFNNKRYKHAQHRLQFDLEHTLNGLLGGLVAITAGCDINMYPGVAIFIGCVAGISVVSIITMLNLKFFKERIDDPVGAFAVHGICGILGILAVGFLKSNFIIQVIGVFVICSWSYLISFALFRTLKKFGHHRVSAHDELHGLDYTHHGKSGYYLRRDSLFNPGRKIPISEGDLREELLTWRQTAVQLSVTGRFLGYDTKFRERLDAWIQWAETQWGKDPRGLRLLKEGLKLIEEENDELFDDAYSLICEGFEIITGITRFKLSREAFEAIKESAGDNATFQKMNEVIIQAIMKGTPFIEASSDSDDSQKTE